MVETLWDKITQSITGGESAEDVRRRREAESAFAPLYEAARQQSADLAAAGRRPVLGGLLSKEPVAGLDTLRYEGITPMLLGLLGPVARAVDAPMAAYQGNIPMEDMAGEALGTAGMAALGGVSLAGRGALDYDPTVTRIFAGPNSATANKPLLDRARRMAASGTDRDAIYQETGWFKLPDGQWRYEIDDRDVGLRPFPESQAMAQDMVEQAKQIKAGIRQRNADLKVQPDLFPQTLRQAHGILSREADQLVRAAEGNYGPTWNPSTLGQRATYALTDSELQRAYPDLLNRTIVRTDQNLDNYYGMYSQDADRLDIAPAAAMRQPSASGGATPRSVLLHEMQHAIQGQEGFAKGANTSSAMQLLRSQQDIDMSEATRVRAELFSRADPDARYLAFQRAQARQNGDEQQLADIDTALRSMPLGQELISADNNAAQIANLQIDRAAAFDAYQRHLGELEARLVQSRSDWTPEQRRATPPWSMPEYIPEDRQIVSTVPAPTTPADVAPQSRAAILGLLGVQ